MATVVPSVHSLVNGSRGKYALRHATVACAILLLAFAMPMGLRAQEMEAPIAVQVPLFLKAMTFDRQRIQNDDLEIIVGITFQKGFRTSVSVRDEVTRTLRALPGRKFRIIPIDLDHDVLKDALEQHDITVLYVSPLRAIDASVLAAVAAAAHVTSLTGVPAYVERGIVVGVRLQGDRPRLLVHYPASRLSGVDFSSELLKLAEVIR